jgi:serine/arginine repetitive matrix protein 2
MYNGIGLRTVRGSGTNGYVTKNLSYVKPVQKRQTIARNTGQEDWKEFDGPKAKKANDEILEHNEKRKIELKLFELQTRMEDEGYPDDEIEAKISTMRKEMTSRGARGGKSSDRIK